MDKKKIVFITYTAGRGGASKVMSLVQNECVRQGYEVTYIVRDIFQAYPLNKNINIIELGKNNKFSKWYFVSFLRKYIKENKIDTVVSFLMVPNLINIISCIGLNCITVISERNDPRQYKKHWQIIIKFFYRFADKIIFQTNRAKEFYPMAVQNKGIIIKNPISINAFSKNPTAKIVSAGRLEQQKNQKMLINSFSKIIKEFPDYKLYIYGEGGLRNELEQQILELNLVGKVFLPGNVTDLHEQISDADCFILPSNYEGLSNALLEAMMMGLPVISTNCAGSEEVIINGDNGFLINIGDEEALTQAITCLLKDREKRNQIAEHGKRMAANYSEERIMKKWLNVI